MGSRREEVEVYWNINIQITCKIEKPNNNIYRHLLEGDVEVFIHRLGYHISFFSSFFLFFK